MAEQKEQCIGRLVWLWLRFNSFLLHDFPECQLAICIRVLDGKNLSPWKHAISIQYYDMTLKSLSRVRLFAPPWTVAYQAPPSMEFSRQEYWSGFPFPSPGDLSNPGIEPRSPTLQADALPSELPGKNTKVGCCFLLQGSFPTQGSNSPLLHLLHW